MDKHAKLALEQLHIDNKQLATQNKSILELLEKLADKDYAKLLDRVLSVKQAGPVQIEGELKAVIDGGSGVNVLNFAELEAYFLGLQFAVIEALASPSPVTLIADEPVPVAMQYIDEVLALLANIADKDLGIDFSNKKLNIAWPKKAAEAIPVVLTDKTGKRFYDAVFSFSGGSGGGGTTPNATTPVNTSITAATASTELLASNANRLGASIYNNSTAAMYLVLGDGATAANFTAKLLQDDYYELPFKYVGKVHAAWATATGNAKITELS